VANQWQRCDLDDDSLSQLELWRGELADAEGEILALQDDLSDAIDDLNRTSKVAATLLTDSDDLNTNHRIKLTAAEGGTDIHKYAVILVNPGPNPDFDPWAFLLGGANTYLTLRPPQYGVTPTDPIDLMMYQGNVIYVEVETDADGAVWTNPLTLKEAFTDGGYDELFTSETPDTFQITIFFVLVDVHLPVVADGTQYKFSGGKDTPLEDMTKGFNQLYAGTGKDYETALEQLAIPVAKSTQSPAEILSQTSNALPLSTGTLVKCDGENLISLRAMWSLLGADSDAATTVCGLLPGITGHAIVIWTEEVTTTVDLPACDGGIPLTTTTTVVVGEPNEKPSSLSGRTPNVFWLEEITPSVESLEALSKAGLNDTQLQAALDESQDTVWIIEDPSILTTVGLTCAELLELLELSCEGVVSLSVADAFAELAPASASNGFVSAAWNFPAGASGGGVDVRKALSPETSMADDISDFNDSKCIDPFAKGAITSMIASASAMIDMVTRTVESVRNTVVGTLNKVSGLVANIQSILSKAEALGCLLPIDFTASVKLPSLDFLKFSIELALPQITGMLDIVQEIMDKIAKIICQVVEALNNLIGPVLGLANCLVPGLTNKLANAFGSLLDNLLDQIPCIENPFDLVGMFQTLLGKVNSISEMVTGMVNDILSIIGQLQLSINIKDQTGVEEATGGCASGPLGAIAGSIKSKLGV